MQTYCLACYEPLEVDPAACPACETARPDEGWPVDPRLGTEIAGRQYRVLRRIGVGGFSLIYEVETVVGGLRRALKILTERWAEDEGMRTRFINEAQVLEKVNHPNVARCYAVGMLDEGKELYLLLELVRGASVADLMPRLDRYEWEPLEPYRAVRIASQVGSGLVAAHANGVLHRDLKPGNILITGDDLRNEQAKLIDFGIAKAIGPGPESTQTVIGTPVFMAPEQFRVGIKLDARLDVWQLGATLFCMLTGRPPYAPSRDGRIDEIYEAQIDRTDDPPRPSEVRPELARHPELDELVGRMLSTDRDDRPASSREAVDLLSRVEQRLSPARTARPGGLLEALCRHPSTPSWWALTRYLDGRNTEERDRAVGLLDAWPDELRRASVSWWEQLKHGTPHFLWPLARSLDLSGRGLNDEDVVVLATNPQVASLRALDLSGNEIGDRGAQALADSPHLSGLVALDLSNNEIGAEGVRQLGESHGLESLRELRLAGNRVGPEGARALAGGVLRLTRLSLADAELGAAGAENLAGGQALRALTSLDLAGNALGPGGAAAMAVSLAIGGLQELNLARNGLGPAGAAALALSKGLAGLRVLSLENNAMGEDGVTLLARGAAFETLVSLNLSSNMVGSRGAMALVSTGLVRRLRELRLGDADLGDAGLATLLGSPQLSGLATLDVARSNLTASGIQLLASALPQLRGLVIAGNRFDEASTRAMADALRRTSIEELDVSHCELDCTGLAGLVDAGEGRLRTLRATHNPIGPDGFARLAASAGLSGVTTLDLSGTGPGPGGAGALAASPFAGSIEELVLDGNDLGDEGVVRLVTATGLTRLVRLSLRDNAIGVDGAEALATSPLAARLRSVDLGYNMLGEAGAEALAEGPAWYELASLGVEHNRLGFSGAAALVSAPGLAMLQHLDVRDNAFEGEVDTYSLGEGTLALLEASFARITPRADDFAGRFYELLFERYPSVKPLFARTDMMRQRQHLLTALASTMDNLREPDALEPRLQELARRHVRYGVSPSQYFAVTDTLHAVIAEIDADAWGPELAAAWYEGLEAVSRVMIAAHVQRVTPAANG